MYRDPLTASLRSLLIFSITSILFENSLRFSSVFQRELLAIVLHSVDLTRWIVPITTPGICVYIYWFRRYNVNI